VQSSIKMYYAVISSVRNACDSYMQLDNTICDSYKQTVF